MVNALITVDENTNRVLNMVKAKYSLKDKSQAIAWVVEKYIQIAQEPDLKPNFVEKMKKIEKQKGIKVDDFTKRYGI